MTYDQVVLLTHCETTPGHPVMLRDMASYLGFLRHPEYQVYEVAREFGQTFYRAIVRILADVGPRIVHQCEASASTVEMAVQQAAYVCLTILRSEYSCFDTSPFRHVPCGFIRANGSHYTEYNEVQDLQDENETCLLKTAQFAQYQDAMTEALALELATAREQLHQTLSQLATYTREFVGDDRYSGFELPPGHRLPDVGGYTPARGPLLTVGPDHGGPLTYGAQGTATPGSAASSQFFDGATGGGGRSTPGSTHGSESRVWTGAAASTLSRQSTP